AASLLEHRIRNLRAEQLVRQPETQEKRPPAVPCGGASGSLFPVDPAFRHQPLDIAEPHEPLPVVLRPVNAERQEQAFRRWKRNRPTLERNGLQGAPDGARRQGERVVSRSNFPMNIDGSALRSALQRNFEAPAK